jgi:hypothetical protein
MKNRLFISLCLMFLIVCFQSFGQESLILNSNWNKKIKENYHLSMRKENLLGLLTGKIITT